MQDERLVVGDSASPSGASPRGETPGVANPCVVASAHLYLGSVFVLGEGVGGAEGGRVESRIAVSAVLTQFRSGLAQDPRQRLVEALRHASEVLRGRAQTGPLFHNAFARCLAVLVRRGRLYAARVGNIELGLMVGKSAEGRSLVRAFEWLPSDSERLLGQGDHPSIEVLEEDVQLEQGDRFLLANGALFASVPPEEVRRLAVGLLPAVAARRLVEVAERGASGAPVSVQVVQAGQLHQHDDVPEPSLPSRTGAGAIQVGEPIGLVVPTTRLASPSPIRREDPRRPLPAPLALGPLTAPSMPHEVTRVTADGSGPLSLEGRRGRDRTPLPELGAARTDGERGLRWLGGVTLIALLAVVFSWAFPRPARQDDAEASGDDVARESALPRLVTDGPAAAPVDSSRLEAGAFWQAVARHFSVTGEAPEGQQLADWLGADPADRVARLRELKLLAEALDSELPPARDPMPVADAGTEPSEGPAVAAEAPPTGVDELGAEAAPTALNGLAAMPAVGLAAVEPDAVPAPEVVDPEVPAAGGVAVEEPAAANSDGLGSAALDAAPVAALDAAPVVAEPSPTRSRQQRHLDHLFRSGRPADESAQKLRDYIHRRHEKVDAVLAQLDAYVDAAPDANAAAGIPTRGDIAKVVSRIGRAEPGPKTRAWAKAVLARLR